MVRFPCQLVVVDDSSWPTIVEARFQDANGRWVGVIDKEPFFAAGDDSPGRGWVCGTEVRREGHGYAARIVMSLAVPYHLETTEGAETVEVWARDVVDDEPSGE